MVLCHTLCSQIRIGFFFAKILITKKNDFSVLLIIVDALMAHNNLQPMEIFEFMKDCNSFLFAFQTLFDVK